MSATTIQLKQKDVGGWVMFFCILLIFIVPLVVMAMAWSGDFGTEVLFNIAWAAYGVLVGAMLWNIHPRAFILLWIYFGMTALLIVLAVVNLAQAGEGATAGNVVQIFRSIKQSSRVRATFGRNL